MGTVHKKLMQARVALQKIKLEKSGHNKFAGFQYFELGDFLPQVQEIFAGIGLCGVVSFDEKLASLTITDFEDGSSIIITSPMAEANLKGVHPIQNMGAVETYSRRYLWVTALEIVEHDALDASAGKKGDAPVITPRGGIGSDLPQETKEYLAEKAQQVTELCNSGKALEALNMLDAEQLEADQKVYLFDMLQAPVRTALKKAKPAN